MPGSPLEFGGSESFSVPPEQLYNLLTDIDAVRSRIPDLVSSQRTGPQSMDCVVRPGFSFLRGTLKLHIELTDLKPPKFARMLVAAQGIGMGMRIDSQLAIDPAAAGSLLTWSARITELKGLIAALSPALLRAAAETVVRQTWERVREKGGMMNAE